MLKRLFVLLPLLACGDATSEAPTLDAAIDASLDASRPDAGPDATIDAAREMARDAIVDASEPEPAAWLSATTTTDDGAIVIEKVEYLSDGLRVFGQVCRPKGVGPYPVHVMNHGGFSGLPTWNGGNCANAARDGWVAVESSYRGEDGSEGAVEVCLGEVDDVLRMLAIVHAQTYANPARTVMSGISHGGCITLRALQRGAPVQLAVDIFGPTDWTTAYEGWTQAVNGPQSASYRLLIDALETATGGTPATRPDEYARRSPVTFGLDFPAPLLIVQGTADAFVPTSQACALADDSFERLHVTWLGTVVTSAPAGCSGTAWSPGPRPTSSWPRDRYLIVYDDVGHNFEGLGTSYLIADMTAFLIARLPS